MIVFLKKGLLTTLLLISALGYVTSIHSAIEEHNFATPAQEQLYQQLIQELRCLVCQNQNLADSNADLAKDLRNKTYSMVIAGNSHQQISKFMTDRYGDFVMYRPPVKATTALLWFGPFLLLALAVIIMMRRVRKKKLPTDTEEIEGLQQAKDILKEQ
ncbi:MAG: cytochrome c-type biogenesis protein CcmH [Gammaproteobacteria bacterium]|jgi:cytochrome c-type biogenesis protein CcmH